MRWPVTEKFISLTVILFLVLTGCSANSQEDITVNLEMEPNPPAMGPSSLMLKMTTNAGEPITGAEVKVVGNMQHDDMQPLLASFKEQEAGVYQTPFQWTMGGDWVMEVSATLPDGQQVAQSFEVTVQEKRERDGHVEPMRVPNNGEQVHILSPADGASFKSGEDVIVKIMTENFDLSQVGNHWHIYVDGYSALMISRGMTETFLPELSPGEHEISVYLSIETHEELEDGATVTITIEGDG